MSAMSAYLSDALLDHVFQKGAAPYTPPSKLHVGLYTVMPDALGGGTEVSGGSYTRPAVSFDLADNGQATNSVEVNWPTATDDWGTVVGFGIFDDEEGGNLLYFGSLHQARTIAQGEAPKMLEGALVVIHDTSVMSLYLANALLDHVLQKGAAPFTPPANHYLGLYTVAPDASGGGTEVSGASYERQEVVFDPADEMEAANSDELAWAIATEDWGTFPALAIHDAQSGGNMLCYGLLEDPRTIATGESFRMPAGNLVVIFE